MIKIRNLSKRKKIGYCVFWLITLLIIDAKDTLEKLSIKVCNIFRIMFNFQAWFDQEESYSETTCITWGFRLFDFPLFFISM